MGKFEGVCKFWYIVGILESVELIPSLLHKLTYNDDTPMPIDPHTSIDTYTGIHISDNISTVR